jgi:hypothetical protein
MYSKASWGGRGRWAPFVELVDNVAFVVLAQQIEKPG